MPHYSVRMYSSYVDEFEVEAASEEEAVELAEQYQYICEMPKEGEIEQFTGIVEQVAKHQYVDHDDTYVNELDEHGNYLE